MSSEAQKYRVLIAAYEEEPITISPELNRYWNDPEYRQQLEADRIIKQRLVDRKMDEAMIRDGVRWPKHWTAKEKYEATAHLRGLDQ
ncbi:hypothetical protein AB1K62_14545 [Parasphingorhabdus sp. JC815]|uniref:hypothetical protein n=1 Tax=Parasphingorhabdus sp. JC815 TaxID=3232140 RepID=UPI003457F69A